MTLKQKCFNLIQYNFAQLTAKNKISRLQASVIKKMSSSADSRDHLKVTEDQQREDKTHKVIVTDIQDISPTVKKLTISTNKNQRPAAALPINFKAGQWVDFFIPEVEVVGGFSMVSSPIQLQETGSLELAVKYSLCSPSHWVHTKCKVGSEIEIRVGGDFFFDTDSSTLKTNSFSNEKILLLVAGGVGINPIASIFKQIHHARSTTTATTTTTATRQLEEHAKVPTPIKQLLPKTILLYSAKTVSELLFKNEFEEIAKKDKFSYVQFYITGEKKDSSSHSLIKYGRINGQEIKEAVENITGQNIQDLKGKLVSYLCGPPQMIQDIESSLKTRPFDLEQNRIFFEKWWS